MKAIVDDPLGEQQKVFHYLIKQGKRTLFGRHHSFNAITDYESFKQRVPLRTYEDFLPYIQRIQKGEKDILWKGVPKFFGKSSGTTSNTKFIPVTKASLVNQVHAPKYAALNYAHRYNTTSFLKGKMLLFSDGHFFENIGGIKSAPISTIAYSCIPKLYSSVCLPSTRTNAIRDYERRIEAMVKETVGKDIRTVVAMPVWLLVYLRALPKITGKHFKDHFPNFQLLLLSGMDYAPYLPEIREYIRPPFDVLETYPSTEGFIAYGDRVEERGMQMVLNKGIFYEFVPVTELYKDNPKRICLTDVQVGINYALVLNTNAGLWGYVNGDTVRFKTVFPHRFEITGRIAQYISAFGEHVTLEEADKSISEAVNETGTTLVDYTVAPNIKKDGSIPYHEWFVEFGKPPADIAAFEKLLDKKICNRNFSYKDLVVNKAIEPLKINIVRPNGFIDFLRHTGKTGLQQKVPHLSNDYKLANRLKEILHLPSNDC
ncbi:MAG: GH3 auxin-responsive promoter family protein [Flavisolibacter sp.]|nr:GH3 auxin-responsive promoter family protein [Flavisolibacter sp.]